MKKVCLSILCLSFASCSAASLSPQPQIRTNSVVSISDLKLLKCSEETKINYLAQMLIKACIPDERVSQFPHGPTILATFRGEVIARKQYKQGSLILCEQSDKRIPKLNQPQQKMVQGFLTDCPTN